MKIRLIILVSAGILAATPAMATIDYGGQSYSADLQSGETTSSSLDLDLENITPSSSVGFIVKFGRWAGETASNVDTWLKDKAGIDVINILKTIANWFVVVVQWMIDLIKTLLTKL